MSTASVTNTFVNAATADADEVNTNFSDLVTFLNGSVVHVDGSKAFTGVVSGITPTADAHLTRKDYVDGIGKMAGTHRATTDQTLTKQTITLIECNTETFASDAAYYTVDTTTDYDITVLKAGVYLIEGAVTFASATNDDSERQVQVQVNGGNVGIDSRPCTDTTFVRCHVTVLKGLSANDTIRLTGYHLSASDLDVKASNTDTMLRVVRLSGG